MRKSDVRPVACVVGAVMCLSGLCGTQAEEVATQGEPVEDLNPGYLGNCNYKFNKNRKGVWNVEVDATNLGFIPPETFRTRGVISLWASVSGSADGPYGAQDFYVGVWSDRGQDLNLDPMWKVAKITEFWCYAFR